MKLGAPTFFFIHLGTFLTEQSSNFVFETGKKFDLMIFYDSGSGIIQQNFETTISSYVAQDVNIPTGINLSINYFDTNRVNDSHQVLIKGN